MEIKQVHSTKMRFRNPKAPNGGCVHELILPLPGIPEIEVNTPAGQIDLHSFAYFDGLRYGSDGTLKLRWYLLGDEVSKLDGRPVKWAQLNFAGVSRLSITPRDPEIPKDEDASLEHYQVLESGPELIRMAFEFIGGSTIDVTAEKVSLSVRHSFADADAKEPNVAQGIDIGRVADALHLYWNLPIEIAFDVAFHLGDSADDWRRLLPMLERANEFTDDELGDEILSMIIHTPNHLMAAAHLMSHTPTDVWGLGIEVVPESSD